MTNNPKAVQNDQQSSSDFLCILGRRDREIPGKPLFSQIGAQAGINDALDWQDASRCAECYSEITACPPIASTDGWVDAICYRM
jgi:hypothetical protein